MSAARRCLPRSSLLAMPDGPRRPHDVPREPAPVTPRPRHPGRRDEPLGSRVEDVWLVSPGVRSSIVGSEEAE
jgi:hypothetical protein